MLCKSYPVGTPWSFRAIAKKCKTRSHKVIYDLWNGTAWPTARSIARIEIGLGSRLWGDKHLRTSKRMQMDRDAQASPDHS